MDTDSNMVVARGKGVEGYSVEGDLIYSDRRWFDLSSGHTVQYTDLVS